MRPTAQGLARYPETDGYYTPAVVDATPIACTCAATCAQPCRGECGCAACAAAWQDWDSFGRIEEP